MRSCSAKKKSSGVGTDKELLTNMISRLNKVREGGARIEKGTTNIAPVLKRICQTA